MKSVRIFPALLMVALVSGGAPAADDVLDQLEKDYLAKRQAAVRPPLVAYVKKLQALEDSFMLRRDASHAAAVRTERERVQAQLNTAASPGSDTTPPAAPTPKPAESENPLRSGQLALKPAKAQLSGGVVYDANDDALYSFAVKGAAAEWKLPALPPGRYRFGISYGCKPGNGGKCRILFTGRDPILFTSSPTGDSGGSIDINLGEIEFTTPPSSVRIEVIELAKTATNVMGLRGLALKALSE